MESNDNSLLKRLDGIESRFAEVATLLADPAVIADMKRFVHLTKEYKNLEELVASAKRYRKYLAEQAEATQLLATEKDPDIRQMAREQLDEANARIPAAEEEIKLLLLPADPEDDKNAILEIRQGTGGDEAALFAGDLFKMYQKFCESRGWQFNVTSFSEGQAGGFKEVIVSVNGQGV